MQNRKQNKQSYLSKLNKATQRFENKNKRQASYLEELKPNSVTCNMKPLIYQMSGEV